MSKFQAVPHVKIVDERGRKVICVRTLPSLLVLSKILQEILFLSIVLQDSFL